MARGGYREPSDPAPVSNPGSGSKRTDGGPAQKLRNVTGLPYGQNQALNDIQAAEPLAQTPGPRPAARPSARGAAPGAGVVPFGAPTTRPDEPVTAGAPLGPGPGPEALGNANLASQGYQTALSTLQQVAASSGSTEVAALVNQLQSKN